MIHLVVNLNKIFEVKKVSNFRDKIVFIVKIIENFKGFGDLKNDFEEKNVLFFIVFDTDNHNVQDFVYLYSIDFVFNVFDDV